MKDILPLNLYGCAIKRAWGKTGERISSDFSHHTFLCFKLSTVNVSVPRRQLAHSRPLNRHIVGPCVADTVCKELSCNTDFFQTDCIHAYMLFNYETILPL